MDQKIRILIVEDDPELLSSLESLFKIFEFEVYGSKNGVQALESISQRPVEILLTDVRMPKMSGLELLKSVKQIDNESPKVIVISGYTDVPLNILFQEGADGFFHKPFDATTIRDHVLKTLLPLDARIGKKIQGLKSKSIQFTADDIQCSVKGPELNFGRSGFFVQTKTEKFEVNDYFDFELNFNDNQKIPKLSGQGRVCFVNNQESDTVYEGLGVELYYVNDEVRQSFIESLESFGSKVCIPGGLK